MADEMNNFINASMAQLLTDNAINACITNVKRQRFAAQHFNINGGEMTKEELDPYLMNQRGTIRFRDFMDLIDMNQNNWQIAMARIAQHANRSGTNHRLEVLQQNQIRLHELTIGQMQCRALTKSPPVYDQKRHISLAHFSNTEWKYFYLSQGMNRDYSKQFLAMAFTNNDSLRDNIQELIESKDPNSTLDQIVQAIKDEINLDSETDYQKQALFNKWEFDNKLTCERNWSKLYTLRSAAWPNENAGDHFSKTKEKFLRKLNVKSNSLHQTLYQWSLTQDFQGYDDRFRLAGKIREIELRFKSSNDERRNSVTPTLSQPSADMEIDSLRKKIKSIMTKKFSSNQNKSKSKSKSKGKACEDCGKEFNPLKSFWKRCRDCQQKKKNLNNLEKGEDKNSSGESSEGESLPELANMEVNEVSNLNSNIGVYKLRVEIQNFSDQTSVVGKDSIYDTGANLFAMSEREMNRIDTEMGYNTPLLNTNPSKNPVTQGDGSLMDGFLGERHFYVTLVDSEGSRILARDPGILEPCE